MMDDVHTHRDTPRPDNLPAAGEDTKARAASPALQSMSTGIPLGTWRSSATSSPSPEDLTTPFPQERSRLHQVLDLFRRRASSSSRVAPAESLRDAREHVEKYVAEVNLLQRRLAATEAELASREASTQILEATNRHAQDLLKRNNELELLIAQIQDESDALLSNERQAHRECRVSLRLSSERVEDLAAQLAVLKQSKAATMHSAGVAEEIQDLKLSLTQHEIDLAAVKAELDENKSFINELQRQLDAEKATVKKLQLERRCQMDSLSNIGGELDQLLKDNKTLDELLAQSRAALDAEIESHRLKLKEAFETSKAKDKDIASLKLELESKKNEIDTFVATIDRLKSQNAVLQGKSQEFEVVHLNSSKLTAQLAQSEERRRLEQLHYEENLKRVKARLESLEGVQQRAADLLSRNSELERLVSELRKKVSLLSKIPEGSFVKQLKDELQSKTSALTGAHETLRAQAADIKLLEKCLSDHKRRLQAAEITASRIEQPKQGGPESRAWQEAVEKVMAATRDDARREIDRIVRDYDTLVKSIREAHSKEMEQRELEFQARFRSTESTEQKEHMALNRHKELEKLLEQSRNEIQTLMLRKDQEVEVYKQEFERSFTRLQSRKIEEIRDQLTRKEEECRRVHEDLILKTQEQRKEYETQIENIKRAHDVSQMEKDQKIGQLEAAIASQKEKMANREKELDMEIQKEASLIAEGLIEKYKQDFNTWVEHQKREHDREVTRVREEFKVLLEDAKRENDRLRLENEMDVSNLRRDHESRMTSLRSTLTELVDQATLALKNDLHALQDQLATTQEDRDKISEDNIRLGREVNRLRAGIDERDAQMDTLRKQQQSLEAANAEQMRELQVVTEFAAKKSSAQPLTTEPYESLLSRNAELEELVATVSEKYHEELKTRMENSADLTRMKLEFESKIRNLNIEIESLKLEKASVTATDSTAENLRSSLESRLSSLTSQVVQLESEKQQLVSDLEVERTRVNSLRQQLASSSESTEERRKLKIQLVQKIQDIQSLAANWDPVVESKASPTAEAASEAEKKRLEAEISSLKGLVLDRQKTIAYLETSLRDRVSSSAKSDQLASQVRQLQVERESLVAETKLLEESLKRQESSLLNEIKQRDVRLQKLTGLNDTLSTTLQRNSELEQTVDKLLKELHSSCTDLSGGKGMLIDLVEKFEEEFRTRTLAHEEDLKGLTNQLDERETEIARLQVELRNLKSDLEANHAEQMKSQRVQFESKIERLKEENKNLINKRADMEADLEKITIELTKAKQNGTERINQMISDLTDKLKDHELTIAEIQTERDVQTQKYEAMLRVSTDVQAQLKAEIDRVSAELAGKEKDILELTKAIKQIMSKEGIEDVHLDSILDQAAQNDNPLAAFTGERWTNLMGTLEALFFKLSKSQHSARSLMSMLNALLKEQQESLQSIAASQAAAIQNHSLMAKAVSSDMAPSDPPIQVPSFAVYGGDLSLVGEGLSTLQNELRVLKEARKSLMEPGSNMMVRRMSPHGGSTTARTSTGGRTSIDEQKATTKRRFMPDTVEDCESKRARLTP